jgi:hypothetical protein
MPEAFGAVALNRLEPKVVTALATLLVAGVRRTSVWLKRAAAMDGEAKVLFSDRKNHLPSGANPP